MKRWSLYQFWPMAKGLDNIVEYSITDHEYDTLVSSLRTRSTITIGGGNIAQRKPKYFFVRSDGIVYTVNGHDYQTYYELGSIFDSQVLDRWAATRVLECNNTIVP